MFYFASDYNEYEWDVIKAINNLKKHGVNFPEGINAIEDGLAVSFPDDYPYEERYRTLGIGQNGSVLMVIYTFRDNRYRIISVRKATKNEVKLYHNR